MWFYNSDNIALNLAKATTISIKQVANKFKVYAYYTEEVQEKYLLKVFNNIQDAQIFIKSIITQLNTIQNTNNSGNNNTSSTSSDNNNNGTEYAFITFDN